MPWRCRTATTAATRQAAGGERHHAEPHRAIKAEPGHQPRRDGRPRHVSRRAQREGEAEGDAPRDRRRPCSTTEAPEIQANKPA